MSETIIGPATNAGKSNNSKKLNLCEILKGHEGETFYCSLIGENVGFQYIIEPLVRVIRKDKVNLDLCSNGGFCPNGECLLFPSKDQRDWNKWIEEQNNKTPKTWSELVKRGKVISTTVQTSYDEEGDSSDTLLDSPIEKSALALLKIHQLIEVGYGGNVTNEEWNGIRTYYSIYYSVIKNKFEIYLAVNSKSLIAFHTKEQAEEFLIYPENVQLLKDYFMI